MKGTPLQRLWAKIEMDSSGCWLWEAGTTHDGYALWRPTKSEPTQLVHRWTFQQFIGAIPDDEELHHECEVRHCVNPNHLTPTTHSRHMALARKSHCKHGHPLSGDNLYERIRDGKVERNCRACNREAARRYANKRKDLP